MRDASKHHFIATTVDLLTTGVDVPCVRNIVFFKYVRSPISLYQMIGRGTRIHEETGKLMFTVHDYTDATGLLGKELRTASTSSTTSTGGGEEAPPLVEVDGFDVQVTKAGKYVVVNEKGQDKRISMDEYRRRFAEQLIREAPTLNELRSRWVEPTERQALLERLRQNNCSADVLQMLQEMNDYDLYDILADLGFGMLPRTRAGRADAFTYKHEKWLQRLPAQTAAAIRAIVSQFEKGGTDELENTLIFQTPGVAAAGGIDALRLGGDPGALLRATKERVFRA